MLILAVWSRGCSGLIGSLGRRGGCRRLWIVFVLLLVLLVLKEWVGVVGGEAVGGRRGGRSSSLIKGRLGAILCCFVALCCCVVWCYGMISTRRDDCGCDSVLSSRPEHTDPLDEQPRACQIIARLRAWSAPK